MGRGARAWAGGHTNWNFAGPSAGHQSGHAHLALLERYAATPTGGARTSAPRTGKERHPRCWVIGKLLTCTQRVGAASLAGRGAPMWRERDLDGHLTPSGDGSVACAAGRSLSIARPPARAGRQLVRSRRTRGRARRAAPAGSRAPRFQPPRAGRRQGPGERGPARSRRARPQWRIAAQLYRSPCARRAKAPGAGPLGGAADALPAGCSGGAGANARRSSALSAGHRWS
jgi:hypothetical protein